MVTGLDRAFFPSARLAWHGCRRNNNAVAVPVLSKADEQVAASVRRETIMAHKERPWLIMLCFYFGRWPAWINFFVESCKWNPDVHWRIYTDCGEPENHASNIAYV